ncbi:MAG TPA: hypothetical protein EYF95_08080 [Flavobacteriales bacterium]|nr:hypothetical protein [Flavobacteriales bacterium]
MHITMFDERGDRKEVILESEDYPNIELNKDAQCQFDQAISDIACSSIDLTINNKNTPYGAHG